MTKSTQLPYWWFSLDFEKFFAQNRKVPLRLSFRKSSILNFGMVTLRDTMIQSYLIGKNIHPYESSYFELSCTLGDVFIHLYFISRVKSKPFHHKGNSSFFC